MSKAIIKFDEYGLRHNEINAYNVLLKYHNVIFELEDLKHDLDKCDFGFCDLDIDDPNHNIYNAVFENINDQITVDCFIDIFMEKINDDMAKGNIGLELKRNELYLL